MIFFKLIAVLLILFSFSSIAHSQETNDIELKNKEWITSNGDEYTVSYPNTWEFDVSGQHGTRFFIFSQLENKEDDFRENINLIIQDLSANAMDLDEFTKISTNQVKEIFPDGIIIVSSREKNKEKVFHKMIYTGNQSGFNLKFKQYYWIENKKAFVLTFTSVLTKFESFKLISEQIMNSFIIK